MALRTTIKGELRGRSLSYPVKFGEFDNSKNTTVDGRQVWLYFGDSLALGTNQGTDTGPEPYYANSVYYWNEGSSAAVAVTTSDIGNANAGSMWPKFGIDYYKRTGLRCVFVRNGIGGSNYFPDGDTNDWYDYVGQYAQAVSTTKDCLANLGLTEVRGVIILCGINDARNAQDMSAIKTAIMMLVPKVNRTLGTPQIYFINVGRDENGNGRGQRVLQVDEGIQDACKYFANCWEVIRLSDYITTPFIYSNSFADVHLTQFGYDFIGAKAVKNMLSMGLISNTPRKYTYGTTVSATLSRLQGITEDDKMAVNDFIEYMVSKSEWTAKFDAFYCPLFNDPSNCIQDWLRDKKLTFPGSGKVLPNRGGLRTDGTTGGRIMSNYTPSVDAVNYAQNNAMAGAWVFVDNQPTGADYFVMGVNDGTQRISINYNNANSNIRSSINSISQAIYGVNRQFQRNSLYVAYRNSSTNTNITENFQSTTGAITSIGVPTREVPIGANDNNGTPASGMAATFGPIFFGAASSAPNGFMYKKIRELIVDMIIQRE